MIVWLASYPRSGNTFLRVALSAVFGIDTYTLYDERPEHDPFLGDQPPLELHAPYPVVGQPFNVARFGDQPQLHVVKTHGAPLDAQPAIYVVRDGREATSSYFHYHRDLLQRPAPLSDVIHGRVGFGSWGRHIALWKPLTRPNTLVLRFEELTAAPIAQIERIADFLGIEPVGRRVPTFEDLHRTAPSFFRSGRTDSWRSLFSEQEHELFWELHGDEMSAFGYGHRPAMSHPWLHRHRRLASRFAEATRPLTDAGRSAARRLVHGVAPALPAHRAA